MAILEVRGVVKYYGRRQVVKGVSFDVEVGEVVGLLGPNGAGKTTSFRMTTGQITPYDGQVLFAGQDVSQLPMYRRARLGMGYLSQEQSVFRRLTVEQNIIAILEALPQSRTLGRKLRRSERWERCEAVMKQFGLTHIRNTPAGRASGGEKRRLEIARCLVCEPLLILLDEPFAGVDPLTKAHIRGIVRDLAKQGIGILMTDHDVGEVLETTDRIYLIKDGLVLTQGTPSQIRRDTIAIEGYLGEKYRLDERAAAVAAGGARPEVPSVEAVLEMERVRRAVAALADDGQATAAYAELVRRGSQAVPALLEALAHRDPELRRRAFVVVKQILGPEAVFDPAAPEPHRRAQLDGLRRQAARLAA